MARKVKRKIGGGGGRGGGTLLDAQRLMQSMDYAGAIEACGGLLRAQPGNAHALAVLGMSLSRLGRYGEANEHLEKALAIQPRLVEAYLPLAWGVFMLGDSERSLGLYDRMLEFAPSHPEAIAAKANVLRQLGRREESAVLLEHAVQEGVSSGSLAVAWSRVCEDRGTLEESVEALGRVACDAALPSGARVASCYRLGEVQERLGRYEQAWEAYTEANSLERIGYDRARHDIVAANVVNGWTREALSRIEPAEVSADEPRMVFIVGMPRSGTSLVEQVLEAHPEVEALGEVEWVGQMAVHLQGALQMALPDVMQHPALLSRGVCTNARREYYRKVRERVAGNPSVVTDKLPGNVLNLGLISKVFPDARVVHCARDATDTCLSCYFHNFGSGIAWAYDLKDCAHFSRMCERVMGHWRGMVGVPVLEHVYEAFVEDAEGGTRTLVEFVGLEWDEACLRFYASKRVVKTLSVEQVTKPVYRSSVKRWERFSAWVGDLREALGEGAEGEEEAAKGRERG